MTRPKSAFTLLELITVVGILGLLMAILVPSLSAARRHAKANVCLSHLKGIGNSFEIYLNENEDKFPPFRLEKLTPTAEEYFANDYGRRTPRWQWFLETDLGPVIDPVPFQRLGHPFGDEGLRLGREGTTMTIELFTCPELMDDQFAMDVRDGAFGYNYQYLGNTRQDKTRLEGGTPRWDNFAVGRHRIRAPGSTVIAADSRGVGPRHGKHSFTLDPPRLAVEENAMRFGPVLAPDEFSHDGEYLPESMNAELAKVYAYSPVEPRHNKRGNVLFVDTHAEAMTLKELGYELADGTTPPGVRRGAPVPIHDPETGTYTATNKLWNGEGVDRMAQEHRPPIPEP